MALSILRIGIERGSCQAPRPENRRGTSHDHHRSFSGSCPPAGLARARNHSVGWRGKRSNGFSQGQFIALKSLVFLVATFAPLCKAIAASRPSTRLGLPLPLLLASPARRAPVS